MFLQDRYFVNFILLSFYEWRVNMNINKNISNDDFNANNW